MKRASIIILGCCIWFGCLSQSYQPYDMREHHEIARTFSAVDSSELDAIGDSLNEIALHMQYTTKYDSILYYLDQSMPLYHKAGNWHKLSRAYEYKGITQAQLGHFESAIINVRRGTKILEDNLGKDHSLLAFPYTSLAIVYHFAGDLDMAQKYYELALERSDYDPNDLCENSAELSAIFQNLAEIFHERGQLERSIDYFNIAFGISDCLPQVQQIFNMDRSAMGLVYMELKNFEHAENCFLQQLDRGTTKAGQVMPLGLPAVINIGRSKMNSGDLEVALAQCRQAESLIAGYEGDFSFESSRNNLLYAEIHSKLGNFSEAIKYAQKGLMNEVSTFNSEDITLNPGPDVYLEVWRFIQLLNVKAQNLHELYLQHKQAKYLDAAENTVHLVTELVESQRQEFRGNSAKTNLTRKALPGYLIGIEIAMTRYAIDQDSRHLEAAFKYAERNKALLLREAMLSATAKNKLAIPDSIKYLENDFTLRLSTLEKDLEEAQSSTQDVRDSLQATLSQLKAEQIGFLQHVEVAYPNYYRVKYKSEIVGLEKVRGLIKDEHTLLVEYIVGPSAAYCFAISSTEIAVHKIVMNDSLRQNIQALRGSITTQGNDQGAFRELTDNAFSIYQQVLEPALQTFPNIATSERPPHLIIIPDGILGYIPFESLITNRPDKEAFRACDWLLRHFSISYGYSSALLSDRIVHETSYGKPTCLAFAPSYPGKGNLSMRGDLDTLKGAWNDLPGAQREVKDIAQYVDGNFYMGEQATETQFKSVATSPVDIIHLAMHGSAHDQKPALSNLVFFDESSEKEDSKLFAYELQHLDLNAKLAVLSACETGTGKLLRGEGIMSLARGFIKAGTQSVVTSLWKVEDRATQKIMSHFYEELSEGKGLNDALRLAKLRYLEETDPLTSHPFYWGSFVLMGDPSPITHGGTHPLIWFAGSGLLILLIFVGYRHRGKFFNQAS